MKRKPVDSEMASSVGYNPKNLVLEIEFRPSGEVWQYLNVPKKVYEEMMKIRSDNTLIKRLKANTRNKGLFNSINCLQNKKASEIL